MLIIMYYVDVLKKVLNALENTKDKVALLDESISKDKNTLIAIIPQTENFKHLLSADVRDLTLGDLKSKNLIIKLVDDLDFSIRANRKTLDHIEMIVLNNETEAFNQFSQAQTQGAIDINTLNNMNNAANDAILDIRKKIDILAKEHAHVEKHLIEFCDAVGYLLFRTKKISKMVDAMITEKFQRATFFFDEEIAKKVKRLEALNGDVVNKFTSASDDVKAELQSTKAFCTSGLSKLEAKYKLLSESFDEFKQNLKNETKAIKDNIANIVNVINQYQ